MSTDRDQINGREWIQRKWRVLCPSVIDGLIATKRYDKDGTRIAPPSPDFEVFDNEADLLETRLGVLIACDDVTLPSRRTPEGYIRGDALTDDIINAAMAIAAKPAWRDPIILRLALRAVAKHQTANALSLAGPAPSNAASNLDFLVRLGLALVAPAALGYGLVAAQVRDLNAVFAMYLVAAGAMAAYSLRTFPRGNEKGSWSQAYNAWSRFLAFDAETLNGVGAKIKLQAMLNDGVRVPNIAFEICDLLHRATETNPI